MSELPVTSVTVADLYRELVGMRTDVAKVLTRLERVDERNHSADQIHTDHEGRIRAGEHDLNKLQSVSETLVRDSADMQGRLRSLEKFRWQIAGALILIEILAVAVQYALFSRK